MLQEVLSFSPSRFNSLPDIELADTEMKVADTLSTALRVLGPVFVKHDMHGKWGISLLHNHWPIEPGELPVQHAEQTNGPREFATRPRQNVVSAGECWPTILAKSLCSEATMEPIEFSTEPYAYEAASALTSEFIREFCKTLAANGLEHTFGLIAPQALSRPDLEFVEFNPDGRVSVLKETTVADNERGRLIETSWRVVPDEVAGTCTKSCFATCTVGTTHSKSHAPVHSTAGIAPVPITC
jgi:hypothetical protein